MNTLTYYYIAALILVMSAFILIGFSLPPDNCQWYINFSLATPILEEGNGKDVCIENNGQLLVLIESTSTPTSTPTQTPTATPTNTPSPTNTLTPSPTATPNVLVLCDGCTLSNFASTPFNLNYPIAQDPTIKKVIKNCTISEAHVPVVRCIGCKNVLIDNCTFSDINSGELGEDLSVITIPGSGDNVTISNSRFERVGSDAIQLGSNNRNITNIRILSNTFVGGTGQENAVDVKGIEGPLLISRNVMGGYSVCNPNVHYCSGSSGVALVIHDNVGWPNNVTIEDNLFSPSSSWVDLNVSQANNLIIRRNTFSSGVRVGEVTRCTQSNNIIIGEATAQWGQCR